MQVPTLALLLSAINVLARERPINTDHPINTDDISDDPSLQDAAAAADMTIPLDDFDLAGDIGSFSDDMDIDMTLFPLHLFGLPRLKATRPFITTNGIDYCCSYSYTIRYDPLPLALRPSRHVLYRFPDTNTRTSIQGLYHIQTDPQCLPSINAIDSDGEIVKTLSQTQQNGENGFTIQWQARLAKDLRFQQADEAFYASEEQAETHTIVLDIPSRPECSLLVLEMHHFYFSAAQPECPIGSFIDLKTNQIYFL